MARIALHVGTHGHAQGLRFVLSRSHGLGGNSDDVCQVAGTADDQHVVGRVSELIQMSVFHLSRTWDLPTVISKKFFGPCAELPLISRNAHKDMNPTEVGKIMFHEEPHRTLSTCQSVSISGYILLACSMVGTIARSTKEHGYRLIPLFLTATCQIWHLGSGPPATTSWQEAALSVIFEGDCRASHNMLGHERDAWHLDDVDSIGRGKTWVAEAAPILGKRHPIVGWSWYEREFGHHRE